MTSETIKNAIAKWSNLRGDSEAINVFLAQGNQFVYDFPSYAENSRFIHAYPGIVEDILYFFLIPADYDTHAHSDDIDQYTVPCLVVKNISGGGNEISSKEALARMAAWDNYYATWVPAQIDNTSYGLFQAFAIADIDFEKKTGSVIINLGLKQSTTAQVDFDADLIVVNPDGKQLIYDDFVKPVPPYGTSAMAQNSFYLLPQI